MRSVPVRVAVVVVSLGLFAARPWAQAISLDLLGPSANSAFGNALAIAGDIDGDGRPDLIVGAPFDSLPALASAPDGFTGSVRVLSGLDGHLLVSAAGTVSSELYGWSVAGLGDVNGDGVPDLLVGAPNDDNFRGRVDVLSGDGGGLLLTVQGNDPGDRFGWSVAALGDVNGDGRPDFAVGAWNVDIDQPGQGEVTVFSGKDGSALHSWHGVAAFDHFGSAVAAAGDVDLDGAVDVLVGGELIDSAAGDAGGASLFSVKSGVALFNWTGEVSGDLFGHAVAGVGDATGDGVPDVLIGAPGAANGSGNAVLFSGADGSLALSIQSVGISGQTGTSVAAAGDLDGDGHADLAVGTPLGGQPIAGGPGHASVLSGVTGAELRGLDGTTALGGCGTALAGADFDLDGTPDLAVGEPFGGADADPPGRVRILSGDDWVDIGAGLAGTAGVPHFVATGAPVAGQTVTLELTHGTPGAPALLIVGLSALNAKFKGGTFVPHPDWFSPPLPIAADGTFSLGDLWPTGVPAGTEVWFQWWITDAGGVLGWASTQGLKIAAQ